MRPPAYLMIPPDERARLMVRVVIDKDDETAICTKKGWAAYRKRRRAALRKVKK